MSYEVLARKYRPQTFGDLVGQEHIVRTLKNAIDQGTIAHAFLFTGIRGVGKTTAARLLARALNCERSERPTPEPCADPMKEGEACSNCREIARSASLDVAEIDGASNRGIDSIRELNDNVRYRPAKGRFKVYIIDEAHMVTREGFNALLKTLEEPPPHVKFIFATTAVDKFPDTIVSRCQRYDFKRIPLKKIGEQLRKIARDERVELSESAVYLIAREAQGSMRDAESLLDRLIAFSGRSIGDREVAEVLAITERKTLYEAADAVLAADARRALEIVDGIYESGRDLERFSRDLLEHWRNLVVVRLYEKDAGLVAELPEDEIGDLRRQAKLRPLGDLQRLFRIAQQGDEELRGSELPRLVLEMSMVRMATLEPAVPISDVLERLDEIQRRGASAAPVVREARPAARPAPVRAAPARGDGIVSEAAEPAPPPAPPAAADGASTAALRWPEFLDFVQGRRISLYLTLSHARVVDEGGGRVVLGVAGEAFRREIESRETMAQIERLAREFFGSALRLEVVGVDGEGEASPAAPAPSPGETLENPAVRKAVEILGGEVREVRNRR